MQCVCKRIISFFFAFLCKLIFFCLLFLSTREDNERSVRALVSNQWHPRGERPTFSSPSTRSHVPMAVTSETMICRRRRRRQRAPHVNVTFCKSCTCVIYVCVCMEDARPLRVKGATLASLAIPQQYSTYFSARGLGNVSSRRLFACEMLRN